MSFDKEELQRIWQEEPLGYLAKRRGMKEYTLTIRPYKRINLEPIHIDVLAKSMKDVSAYTPEHKKLIREKLAEQGVDIDKETVEYSTSVKEK